MLVKPKFPRHRLHDPKRRAELAIYRALEASPMAGVALYEPRFGPYQRGSPMAGVGLRRLAPGRRPVCHRGQGRAVLRSFGQWYLSTPLRLAGGRLPRPAGVERIPVHGWQEVDCPALQAWDGAMNFRDRIARKQGKGPFVVSVVVLPRHGT